MAPHHPRSTRTSPLFPCPTLYRSGGDRAIMSRQRRAQPLLFGQLLAQPGILGERLFHRLALGGIQLAVGIGHQPVVIDLHHAASRSEEHTSELQSLMRISYAVFCLKKNKTNNTN